MLKRSKYRIIFEIFLLEIGRINFNFDSSLKSTHKIFSIFSFVQVTLLSGDKCFLEVGKRVKKNENDCVRIDSFKFKKNNYSLQIIMCCWNLFLETLKANEWFLIIHHDNARQKCLYHFKLCREKFFNLFWPLKISPGNPYGPWVWVTLDAPRRLLDCICGWIKIPFENNSNIYLLSQSLIKK